MSEIKHKSQKQKGAEAEVESFREDLGPFVIAAETTRMAMVFTNAKEPSNPIIFANDSFLALTGYDRKEVLGQSFNFLLAGRDDSEALAQVEAAFGSGVGSNLEIRCRRKDGDAFWATVFIGPVLDETGDVVQHFASFVDLTKHKQEQERLRHLLADAERQRELRDRAEQELRDSEKDYRDLFELSPDGIIAWDSNGIIQASNTSAATVVGYDRTEDLLGKSWLGFIIPEDRPSLAEKVRKVQQSGGVIESEFGVMRKDGSRIFAEARLHAVLDSAGNPVQNIAIVRDITDRKAMETALRDSEGSYRSLFELSPDAIVAWKSNAVIEAANQAAATMLGYDQAEDLFGRSWLDFVVPEDAPARAVATRSAEQSGGLIGSEFSMQRKDGSRFPVEGRLRAALDSAGNPVRTIAIARDITARKQAEHALQRLNRTLRNLVAADTAVVHATTEQTLLDDMCRVCVEVGGYRLVCIGFVEHDEAKTVRPVAWAGEHAEYIQKANLTWADTERGRGPTGAAIRTARTQINQNIEINPAMAPWRADLVGYGFKSSVALPLKSGSEVFGAVTLFAGEPDAFGLEEVDLLEELAGDLAYGIQARRDRAGRETALAALDGALKSTVQAVAGALEMHDTYTAGHERHVADLSVAIARELGLTESLIEGLFLAGLIHDVGKINIPSEFLSKPGKLTPLEYQLIQTHVQAGYDIIKTISFPWPIAQSMLQHHERLDGSGYPNHLKGEAISIEGRILGVADVVDAMQSHRPYRPALGLDAALAEIEQGKGRLYDPAVVDACTVLFRQKGFKFS
jgi:PAS domain S-box-containing protein